MTYVLGQLKLQQLKQQRTERKRTGGKDPAAVERARRRNDLRLVQKEREEKERRRAEQIATWGSFLRGFVATLMEQILAMQSNRTVGGGYSAQPVRLVVDYCYPVVQTRLSIVLAPFPQVLFVHMSLHVCDWATLHAYRFEPSVRWDTWYRPFGSAHCWPLGGHRVWY